MAKIIITRTPTRSTVGPEWFCARWKGFEHTDMRGLGITEAIARSQLLDLWPSPPRQWGKFILKTLLFAWLGGAVGYAVVVVLISQGYRP